MNSNQESEKLDEIVAGTGTSDPVSVDDFIKQLEEKEKDLHIDADSTVIEMAEGFDAEELPDFMKGDFEFTPSKPVPAETAPEPAAKPPKANGKLEIQIEQLKEQIAELKADRDELRAATQRRAKDFENFKSRTERERKETFQVQVGNLATQMLPALDNLNRAVDFALAMPEEQRADIQQFFDGILLVNQQVNDVLAEMGVQPIATVGQPFDPNYHEAVATEESEVLSPNTVSAELLRGYRVGDRVIRHSMVKVVKAGTGMTSSTAVKKPDATEEATSVEPPENESGKDQ